jgi:hypothetical protein
LTDDDDSIFVLLFIRIAFGLSSCKIIPAGLILLFVLIIRIRLFERVHQRAMFRKLEGIHNHSVGPFCGTGCAYL